MTVCARCGADVEHDRRIGVYRTPDRSPYCDDTVTRFPAWKHTPGPLTVRQLRAVLRAVQDDTCPPVIVAHFATDSGRTTR